MAFTWSTKNRTLLVCGRSINNPLYLIRKEGKKGCEFKATDSALDGDMMLCVVDPNAALNYRWIDYNPATFEPKRGVLLGMVGGSPVYLARLRKKHGDKERIVKIIPGYFILSEGIAFARQGWIESCVDTKFQVMVDCSASPCSTLPPSYDKVASSSNYNAMG